MIPRAPHITLLLAMRQRLQEADFAEMTGIVAPFTIRFARRRLPVRSEKPCVTIVFIGDDSRPDELNRNTNESVRELVVELVCDMDVSPEDSELDPTGLEDLSRVLAACYIAMKDPGDYPQFLNGLCGWITPGSIEQDDKSQADEGRLVRGVTVLYRVRSDEPNTLLSAEMSL